MEYRYPWVIKEAVHYAGHLYVFANTGDAGQQRAHATDNHADLDAGLACRIKAVDHAPVNQVIDLERNAGWETSLGVVDLGINQAAHVATGIHWRNQQVVEFEALVRVLDKFKYVVHFTGNLLITREEGEIGIDFCRFFVEVARADMRIADGFALLMSTDKTELGVNFEAW